MTIKTIAGVVLAGGASTRMGSHKALLKYGQATFLDSMAKALIEGGCCPVMTVVSEPSAPVLAQCKLDGVEVIINQQPAMGPISSLRCALGACSDVSGLIVALVDQGRVRVSTVCRVFTALQNEEIVVARYRGRSGHPTGFSSCMFEQLHSSAADQGARWLVMKEQAAGRVCFVDVDDPGVVRNINTREQYERFVRDLDDG